MTVNWLQKEEVLLSVFFLMSWETIDGLYQLKVDVGVLNTMKI